MSSLSSAKAVLLAIETTVRGDLGTLRLLISSHKETFRIDIILRVVLTHLPESLPTAAYVGFIEELASDAIQSPLPESSLDTASVDNLTETDAARKVRGLHLLKLAWPDAEKDIPDDPVVQFLVHRSLRIDQYTGLIGEIPPLLKPFLARSVYLRKWLVGSVLPLVRLLREYHPDCVRSPTIHEFERLDVGDGVNFLLSMTGQDQNKQNSTSTVVRDIKGLVGPWLHGGNSNKRRKTQHHSEVVTEASDHPSQWLSQWRSAAWDEIYKWLANRASLNEVLSLVEGWGGPGDEDLGDFGDGLPTLDQREHTQLMSRYARAVIASVLSHTDAGSQEFLVIHRIIIRLNKILSTQATVPSLGERPSLAAANTTMDAILSPCNAKYLRTHLLDEENMLTRPNELALNFLFFLCTSASILGKAGISVTIRQAGELALLQEEREQSEVFKQVIHSSSSGPKKDDIYWVEFRHNLLWLRSWGIDNGPCRGIFGKVPIEAMEVDILQSLISNTRA